MRSIVRYVPEGVLLDLAKADLGHPDGHAILERHHRQSARSHPEFDRGSPAFVCARHEGGTSPGLYVRKVRGQWWAAHYEKGTCDRFANPAPMSEEHRRQVDYWVRAAEDAGYAVETESALKTGTRPDALIRGPVLTGVEVQLSGMTRRGAVERSRRAALAGVSDVWFTSKQGRAPVGVPGAHGDREHPRLGEAAATPGRDRCRAADHRAGPVHDPQLQPVPRQRQRPARHLPSHRQGLHRAHGR